MHNKTYAAEWLEIAKRNLETAEVLLKQDHYTDIIAIEIHQSIEKTFKTVLAYNGIKIPKTHDLMQLFELCNKYIDVPDELIDDLLVINDYYQTERYPGPKYNIPEKTEIKNNLVIAINLFERVKSYTGN